MVFDVLASGERLHDASNLTMRGIINIFDTLPMYPQDRVGRHRSLLLAGQNGQTSPPATASLLPLEKTWAQPPYETSPMLGRIFSMVECDVH